MTYEILSQYPPADDREQIGRLLRHAFPLSLESFAEMLNAIKGEKA